MVSKPVVILSLFGLVLWVGCSSPGTGSTGTHVALPPVRPSSGSASKYISNVIVVIQENRSFENFFAGWPGANAPMSGLRFPSSQAEMQSSCRQANRDSRPARFLAREKIRS